MKIPYSAQLELTEGCTHKCLHCYNESPSVRRVNTATKEVVDAVSKEDIFSMVLTGGEPLMANSVIGYALEKFSDANMDISVNSNLCLLSDRHVSLFREYDADGFLTSVFAPYSSVHDSITRVDGSFDRTLGSIEKLLSNDIKTSVNMVVMPQNKGLVYETGKMLSERAGVRVFCATPVVPNRKSSLDDLLTREEYIGVLDDLMRLSKDCGMFTDVLHPTLPCIFDSEKQRREYQYFLKNRACGAARSTLTISANGDVRPCSHSDKVYGNILDSSLVEIVGSMDKWVDKKLIPMECSPCSYVDYCKGGCRVSSEIVSGGFDSKHHYMSSPILDKENIFDVSKKDVDFSSLGKNSKDVKFREEADGTYSVFADLDSNANVDEVGLGVMRRFSSGASYGDIVNGLGVKEKSVVDRNVKYLFDRGLLVSNN